MPLTALPLPILKRPRPQALALSLLLAAGPALAQDTPPTAPAPVDDAAPERSRQPLWEVGAFAIGGQQQAYPGSKQQVGFGLALPFVIYRGRWLRADEGTVGLRALKTENTELDIGFSGAFGSSASNSDARRGMPDIGTLVEFGPRLKVKLGGGWRAALPLRGVFDLSDGLASRGLAFEPELSWGTRTGTWNWGGSLSAVFGNRRLTDTFYGVDPVYATAGRPAYEARSGLIATRLALSASTSLSRDWRLFGYARVDSVAGAANRSSPLVERNSGASYGLGLSWTGWRSSTLAAP
jgi:outer membrane protein